MAKNAPSSPVEPTTTSAATKYTLTDVQLLQDGYPTADPTDHRTHIRIGDHFFFVDQHTQNRLPNNALRGAGFAEDLAEEVDVTRAIVTDQHGQLAGDYGQGTIRGTVPGRDYAACIVQLLDALNGGWTPDQLDSLLEEVKGSVPAEPLIHPNPDYMPPAPTCPDCAAGLCLTHDPKPAETVQLPVEDVQ